MVPVEPTLEMREAFHQAHESWEAGYSGTVGSPDYQWEAMLAAAPPGAPPVSAPPAESAGEVDWCELYQTAFGQLHGEIRLRQAAEAKCRELEGEVARAKEHVRGVYEQAASWSRKHALAASELRRITTAAQAARDALEPFASASRIIEWTERATGRSFDSGEPFQSGLAWRKADGSTGTITYGAFHRAREALASLVAVLPAITKAEGSASQERGNG
jgi:hypothetical protein